jgi:hypothetical protein
MNSPLEKKFFFRASGKLRGILSFLRVFFLRVSTKIKMGHFGPRLFFLINYKRPVEQGGTEQGGEGNTNLPT